MNTEQVFQLVDRVLPFEACLYHQILPLLIEDNTLHLGMVMLDDVAALEYARRMVGYQNYTLAPQSISSEAHHKTLTAYLNHGQKQPKPEPKQSIEVPKKPTLHEKETLVVESPDELEWEDANTTDARSLQETISEQSAHGSLPELPISKRYANEPIALLTQLPPARLLQELLGRVLGEGIGRLYFERQAKYGRILWSQNGVLQSSIESLALPKFQAVLDELKSLTHLPPVPVTQTRQVEIERSHNRDRILLRLRIMPSEIGEQATLQVLRGAAMKFHQRQQLTSLSRDALAIAQRLQDKVDELQTLEKLEPEVVPALDQVLEIVERQLTDLKQIRDIHGSQ